MMVMVGVKMDNFFLLHESIDLVELYPTVPVSQIVTRRKYFSAAVVVMGALAHVHPYCT